MRGRFGAKELRNLLAAYSAALSAAEQEINDLNVFPVADGDTGTNMCLTVSGVLEALDSREDGAATYDTVRRAALLAARGTSGIILSQWLRGLCEVLARADPADTAEVAAALAQAADRAYSAVTDPVEGTILTVARAGADAAASSTNGDMSALWSAVAEGAASSLAHTPEMLDVLARAGVVDAGGRGLSLFFDVAAGAEVPQEAAVVGKPRPRQTRLVDAGSGWTEVTLLLDCDDVEALRRSWSTLGTSVAVSGADGEGPWRCHVHTTDTDAVLAAAAAIGAVSGVRTESLPGPDVHVQHMGPAGRTAVVSVATGPGMVREMALLGAVVVSGGETMNPSTEELLDAVVATGAGGVVLLPNDKDAVPVARAVASLSPVDVRVVETATMAAGIEALRCHDAGLAVAEDSVRMAAVLAFGSGSVSRAVRDAETPIGPVRAGDWLGFVDGHATAAGPDPVAVSLAVLDRCGADTGPTSVLVYAGRDASEADTEAVVAAVRAHRPGADVELLPGGQPNDAWLFAVRPAISPVRRS